MKKAYFLFIIALLSFCSCHKNNFFDRFVPEILYFQNADVENADFKETKLPADTTRWLVKARVSAPMKLKEIKLFKVSGSQAEELLQTYSDFQLSPNVYRVQYLLEGISQDVMVKIVAIDRNNKTTVRDFTIKTAR